MPANINTDMLGASKKDRTMRDKVEAMQQRLRLAHRIVNPAATLIMCNEAADLMGELIDATDAALQIAEAATQAAGEPRRGPGRPRKA